VGHTRLGKIPTSQKWRDVVELVLGSEAGDFGEGGEAGGASQSGGTDPISDLEVRRIAADVLDAADGALHAAARDKGLTRAWYLLVRLVVAARSPDWRKQLEELGVRIPTPATAFDLNVAFQAAVDDYLATHQGSTDISEIAQLAAGEALAELCRSQQVSFLDLPDEELKASLARLSTRVGFGRLGRSFFGNFLGRFLNFYLSRFTAAATGRMTIPTLADATRLNQALYRHCYESARIVEDFSGHWMSKTEYLEGISEPHSARFLAVALSKLRKEMLRQRENREPRP
jgi:hypothetical protein